MKNRRIVRSALSIVLSLALVLSGVIPGTPIVKTAYAAGETTTITPAKTAEEDSSRTGTGQMTISLKIKKTPSANDFTFTAPTNLMYDGTAKVATVVAKESAAGMGNITLEYYSGNAKLASAPVAEGTYTVKVNVAEGDEYKKTDGVTDDSWTFTIAPQTESMNITLTIPSAPTTTSITKNSITLTEVEDCEYSKDNTNWQDSTTFSGLLSGTEYTFYQRIKGTQNVSASANFSTLADTHELTITLTIPATPAAPTKASATKNSIELNAVSGCEYSKDGTNWQDSTTFSGLLPGTAYTFYQRIKATDNAVASASSPAATISTEADIYAMTITLVIKPAQTITASDVTATYGDTDKAISASVTDPTTGSGTISYAVKEGSGNYIDVDASTGALTIKAVPPTDGKAYVIVTAAETDTYAKTTKEVAVTINKAQVTVTANNQSIYVGGTVPNLSSPVLNTHYTVTGLKGEDTLTTPPALVYQQNGNAANPNSATAGTYDIVASGASAGANYNISYTKGTLTISDKGTQTITAENVTVTYGDTGKSVSATVTTPATGGGAISYAVKEGSAEYIDVNASTGALNIKKAGTATVVVTAA